MIKYGIKSEKTSTTPFDRLVNAINIMSENGDDDEIEMLGESCILRLRNIKLLSNNDSLRNDNRKLAKFKKLWHKRIAELVKKVDLSSWDNKKPMILEFLYLSHRNKLMDADGIVAAIKSPLDGLVGAGLLFDDEQEYLKLIIPMQKKNKKKYDELVLVLSVTENIQKYYTKLFIKQQDR